jgi:ABC-type Fe3+/spermidine/putrescine transport system ATPase subunit
VFVTHDQEEALSMADGVSVMPDGRIKPIDTPAAVGPRPSTMLPAH